MPSHTEKEREKARIAARVAATSARIGEDITKRGAPRPVAQGPALEPKATSQAILTTPTSVSTILAGETALKREKKATQVKRR
jgi:hypothetical protein